MTRLVALAGVAWLGCSSAAAAAPGAKDPCALRLREYDAVRAAAPGRCAADRDCACYSDIRMDNEMHVSDKASAARLQRLADAYRKRGCPTACVQVVPVKCRPACRAGTCKGP
ncbi:MAG TPA: hypothetical protein VH880_07350 [Anaeromyxobacteraceae bacterium]